jgi:hypothetical protein
MREVAIQLEKGDVKSLLLRTSTSIGEVKLRLQRDTGIPAHRQQLNCNGCGVDDNATIEAILAATEACLIVLSVVQLSTLAKSLCTLRSAAARVVIIGGGPVGLWVAVSLKALAPAWRIDCFEKRAAYVRSHALRFDPVAFQGMLPLDDGGVAALFPGLVSLQRVVSTWQMGGTGARTEGREAPAPRTDRIESDLMELALQLGVNVEGGCGAITIKQFVGTGSEPVDAIICCDGAGSVNRRLVAQEGVASLQHSDADPWEGVQTIVPLPMADVPEFSFDERFDNATLLQVMIKLPARRIRYHG